MGNDPWRLDRNALFARKTHTTEDLRAALTPGVQFVDMEHAAAAKPSSTSLFQVYLRLRPPPSPLVQLTQQSLYPSLPPPERYLTVEPPHQDAHDGIPTHITIHPPSDSRKRAVEKFAFTKVFQEEAAQLDIFQGAGAIPLVEGVLNEGRDGLLATLGVTGSGKVRQRLQLTA
ncbi:MAG: hypothetical protein Q9220_000284 [cf. Caloplaca sp. 1 TL-2023]